MSETYTPGSVGDSGTVGSLARRKENTQMTYTAKIDGGQGGDTTITASSAAEALVEAITAVVILIGDANDLLGLSYVAGFVCEGVDAPPAAVTTTGTSAAMLCAIAVAMFRLGSPKGCDIEVSVENDGDESDRESDTVHILSTDEKLNETLTEKGEVLGEDESEWQTKQVIRIADEYYYRRNNGGSRGAYDHRTNPDVFEVREISQREARKMLLEFGMEPAEVADKTEDR